MNPNAVLRSAWRQQGVWSATATALKRNIMRSRGWVLGLLIAAAILEVVASQSLIAEKTSPAGRIAAGAGAALLAFAALIRARYLGRYSVANWIRARSASEGLKTAVYLYLTQTGEYAGSDPAHVLAEAADRVSTQVNDLEPFAAKVQVTEREPPPAMDVAEYLRVRVESQIQHYYRPRALEFARKLDRFRRIEFALMLTGALLAAFEASTGIGKLGAWVAVVTTITAALGAHIAAARYEQQIIAFRTTARRLETLRDAWLDASAASQATSDEKSALVTSCENAISIENEGWMADLTRESAVRP
jgi:hypothetical protein